MCNAHNYIICPDLNKRKDERISNLLNNTLAWSKSEYMIKLISTFGGNVKEYISQDKTYIEWLYEFVNTWDYRKKQSNGGERWTVYDDNFVTENEILIMEAAESLGMISRLSPGFEPDYILPLGGARRTNLERPQMAKKIIDKNIWKNKEVIALAGMRPISEIEKPYIKEYAPGALTEYEAICKGLEMSFDIADDGFMEQTKTEGAINSQSIVRKYNRKYNGTTVFSLAAPSSEPDKRRANSYDTFMHFLDKFNVSKGSKILLVTSSIYVPFQLLKFMGLAIEHELMVDCIGTENMATTNNFSRPSNYLQEIKSTVDAIYSLWNKYA